MSTNVRALDSFCTPCKNFIPVDTPRKAKPLSFPAAGRLTTVRRIGGLLLAAIVCLLTGKAPLQTFQDDPLDQVVTQNDDHEEKTKAADTKREEERREAVTAPRAKERRQASKSALLDALLDTNQRWDRRKLYRESDGISGKPAALPAGIAEFPSGLRCVSEIDPPRRMQAEPAKIISQEDLTELEILGARFREAKKRYVKKRDGIRRAMEGGASVEAGFRSVSMKTREVLVVR